MYTLHIVYMVECILLVLHLDEGFASNLMMELCLVLEANIKRTDTSLCHTMLEVVVCTVYPFTSFYNLCISWDPHHVLFVL